jgi:dihydroorotate dehydrogenase
MYQHLVRPLLFRIDPEVAHQHMVAALPHVAPWLAPFCQPDDEPRWRVRLLGHTLRHRLGLAAGLDKNAEAVHAWRQLGLAFAEIGTVTPRPQQGNPKPRLFRLPAAEALVNRMGFPGEGAERVRARLLAAGDPGLPLAINIGKQRDTPNEAAADDLLACAALLRPFAAWFVLNVSSPNTPGLRELQAPAYVRRLVEQVRAVAQPVPVMVKWAPDQPPEALEDAVEAALEAGAAGFVVGNTTLERPGMAGVPDAAEAGGLSGRPLRPLALAAVQRVVAVTQGRVPIVGVGGIFGLDDAVAMLDAGADLLQVYTGLVYRGPGLVREIVHGLGGQP